MDKIHKIDVTIGEPTEPGHVLRLITVEQAAEKLCLEAQRWAVGQWLEKSLDKRPGP